MVVPFSFNHSPGVSVMTDEEMDQGLSVCYERFFKWFERMKANVAAYAARNRI